MEVDDRLFFPVFELPVTRDFAVVLVGFAVALVPVVKLAGRKAQPSQQLFLRHSERSRAST